MKFKVGDRVKYTSNDYGDYDDNPLWGGSQGNVIGEIHAIMEHDFLPIKVMWENGIENSYAPFDLKRISSIFPHNSILFETK